MQSSLANPLLPHFLVNLVGLQFLPYLLGSFIYGIYISTGEQYSKNWVTFESKMNFSRTKGKNLDCIGQTRIYNLSKYCPHHSFLLKNLGVNR